MLNPLRDPVRIRRRSAFDIVAIAASAGGLDSLLAVLEQLPGDFPAAVLVVLHRRPEHWQLLGDILWRRTALRVRFAEHGERPRAGGIYLVRPEQQLLVTPFHRLRIAAPKPGAWPLRRGTADPLFISVAEAYGERAIGVVLSGYSEDGARGVAAIKQRGGRVLVEDPRDALAAPMPAAALRTGCSDFALPRRSLGHALICLTMAPGAAALLRVPAGVNPPVAAQSLAPSLGGVPTYPLD